MARITIVRHGPNDVRFDTPITIVRTDNVFFINLDEEESHHPDLISNELGPAPSLSSNPVQFGPGVTEVEYHCTIAGHDEKGTIHIVDELSPVDSTTLETVGIGELTEQQVVTGGMFPYRITGENFEVIGPGGVVLQSGSGIGPGLQLTPKTDNTGIFLSGTPTLSGTYRFRFTVNDEMGQNLQQTRYEMVVT